MLLMGSWSTPSRVGLYRRTNSLCLRHLDHSSFMIDLVWTIGIWRKWNWWSQTQMFILVIISSIIIPSKCYLLISSIYNDPWLLKQRYAKKEAPSHKSQSRIIRIIELSGWLTSREGVSNQQTQFRITNGSRKQTSWCQICSDSETYVGGIKDV